MSSNQISRYKAHCLGVSFYLQGLDQLLCPCDVGNVDGGAESIQHLHFMEDILTTRRADDQQLTTLEARRRSKREPRLHVLIQFPFYVQILLLKVSKQESISAQLIVSKVKSEFHLTL